MFSKLIKSPLSIPITLRDCPFSEYKRLARFHYRAGSPGPVDRCFGLYVPSLSKISNDPHLVGMIVYALPPLNSRPRNLATNGRFLTIRDPRSRATLINRELRTIARVIIHPQFRSLGLAVTLVRETLPLVNTRFVEASAVMGLYHPFFEKAGMTLYTAPPEMKTQVLLAAFDHVGLTPDLFLDPASLLARVKSLAPSRRRFLLTQIKKHYLSARQAVFSSRTSLDLEWTLPRLATVLLSRPAYFLWKNPSR